MLVAARPKSRYPLADALFHSSNLSGRQANASHHDRKAGALHYKMYNFKYHLTKFVSCEINVTNARVEQIRDEEKRTNLTSESVLSSRRQSVGRG